MIRRERARIFRHRVAESLTRSHPAVPFALLSPVLVLCMMSARLDGVGWGVMLLAFASGLFAWTMFEYLLHRFVLHFPIRGPRSRLAAFLLHGHHHVDSRDPNRLVATPWMWGGASLFFLALSWLILGEPRWQPLFAGVMTGYLIYEFVHWSAHHREPKTAAGRWLRRYHLRHHFEDHRNGFGISSPLWDIVFRTTRFDRKAAKKIHAELQDL